MFKRFISFKSIDMFYSKTTENILKQKFDKFCASYLIYNLKTNLIYRKLFHNIGLREGPGRKILEA